MSGIPYTAGLHKIAAATGATVIVPGHGPVTDRAGVTGFRSYLEHIGSYAESQFTRGVPYDDAAANVPLDGYGQWGHPERLVVTMGAIYRNLGLVNPDGQETLTNRMAARYAELSSAK